MDYIVSVKPGGQIGFVATLHLPGQPADRIVEEVSEARALAALQTRVERHPVNFQRKAIEAIEAAAASVSPQAKDSEIGGMA